MKIKVLMGLPASGKSTYSKKFAKENKDWVRINRDDLRTMRGEYWLPKQEKMITAWEDSLITCALQAGNNIILDATNLDERRNKERFDKLKVFFPDLQVEYDRSFLNVPLEECIKRDLKRPDSVGEKVIRCFYDKFLAPPKVVYTEDPTLPKCVIFDIDGTLAKMNGRGPFEWDRVGEDLVNEPIAKLARMYCSAGYKIIVFTGRDGVCLQKTSKWLKENCIPFNGLYARPEGNSEKDSIIKKRLFEENIRGKYNVELVVDDRNSVVDMWRNELGLTCLQVDYGDF